MTPKYLNHESIQEVANFFEDSGGAYKWEVFLKGGWTFLNGDSCGEQIERTLHFNNKKEFDYARPTLLTNLPKAKQDELANTMRKLYA